MQSYFPSSQSYINRRKGRRVPTIQAIMVKRSIERKKDTDYLLYADDQCPLFLYIDKASNHLFKVNTSQQAQMILLFHRNHIWIFLYRVFPLNDSLFRKDVVSNRCYDFTAANPSICCYLWIIEENGVM